jgi:hypothetical protein
VIAQAPFPEPVVPRTGPLGGAEPRVNFYLYSTRPEAVAGRATMNDWYARFPDPTGTFLRRLRSTADADHEVALDELFIHERLTQSASVSYEEDGRGPDFRLYRDSAHVASIEVLSLFMRQDWSAQLVSHSRIADELNRRVAADRWWLHFKIVRLDRPPSIGRLATGVRQTVDALPPCQPSPAGRVSPLRETYLADGVHLDFEFIRKTVPPQPGDRIVGLGPVIAGFVNSGGRLRVALGGKGGKRYDLRDRPFALSVSVHDPFCSLDQIEDALYGSEQVAVASLAESRGDNGFFGLSPSCPDGKNRRISCIFVVYNWYPWLPNDTVILRLDNPFAERPFPADLLPANYCCTASRCHGRGLSFAWLPRRPIG